MRSHKKCLVWDLDNTLWDGICLEGNVKVRREVIESLRVLDSRGILHSIASRGDENLSKKVLKDNGIDEYFLVPQINWLPKSQSITKISNELNLSLDSIAFIDDDIFEREQIKFMLPEVITIDACKAQELTEMNIFNPDNITSEAKTRRSFYRSEIYRKKYSESFVSREDFLINCDMKLNIRSMDEKDMPRVLELMTRTHQLNTTGLILDRKFLIQIHEYHKNIKIFIAELTDKFGSYGIIGTAIIETSKPDWKLKYFALSCRVMGRGIEKAFLIHMINCASIDGYNNWKAEFRDTGRNKMMRVLYQLLGFRFSEYSNDNKTMLFISKSENIPKIPGWIKIT